MENCACIYQELMDGDKSLSQYSPFMLKKFLGIDSGCLMYIVVGGCLGILAKDV